MDEIRKFHFQQDYLGCVDDEANIANKCDARRQVFSDNISSSLSRWLDRLKSTMMTAKYMIKTTTLLKIQCELCMFSTLPVHLFILCVFVHLMVIFDIISIYLH